MSCGATTRHSSTCINHLKVSRNESRLKGKHWVSFLGTPIGETIFAGIYRVGNKKPFGQGDMAEAAHGGGGYGGELSHLRTHSRRAFKRLDRQAPN